MTVRQEVLDKEWREYERKELRKREQRVRRRVERFGFVLQKSRTGARAITNDEEPGYRLFDPQSNLFVLVKEFDASLDIIEMVLRKRPQD